MSAPVRIAFLGCGFITNVHSRRLRALRSQIVCSYASRDRARAEAYRARYGGSTSYGDYESALADPNVDAIVVAVPPRFHLDLTLRALAAGKHVLVEKPAFLTMADYETVQRAKESAGRVVLVGENDHYKPLAVYLRRQIAQQTIGALVFAHFTTIAKKFKTEGDWRNDETMAGGDAFFEEGIHWLHLIASLGPVITSIQAYRPAISSDLPDRRSKSLLVAFQYDNRAAGSLYYSREIPSLLLGLRLSRLYGRRGTITFESNGAFAVAWTGAVPRVVLPGLLRDIRGYQAMYRDFLRAIRLGVAPEMSLERAMDDQRLMDRIYASL